MFVYSFTAQTTGMGQKKFLAPSEMQLTNGNPGEEDKLGPYVIYDCGLVLFEYKLSESPWVNHYEHCCLGTREQRKGLCARSAS